MTETFDVIVIGLGVMGAATAYHLAKRGQRVVALEQFALDHRMGSSYGESRIIRYAYRRPVYVEMAKAAFPLWRELQAETGRVLMQQTGGFDFGPSESPSLVQTRDNLATAGVPFEWLSPSDAAKRFPQFRLDEGMAALYQADAGYLAASRCVVTMAEQAQKYGASLRTDTKVTGITPLADGVRVSTTSGDYEAARLIMIAGAWTGQLMASLGVPLPLQPTREELVFFEAAQPDLFTPEHCPIFIFHDTPWYYGLPNVDGIGVKVAIHGQGNTTDPDHTVRTPTEDYIAHIRAWTERYVPLAAGKINESRVCLYTMTPDEDFIIDRHPAHPQIVFASPCSGHGFKFGILIGRILSDLALHDDKPPEGAFDLAQFRAARFA